MKVRLVLTPKDLQALRGSNTDCPMARSIKRRLKPGYSVGMGGRELYIYKGSAYESTPVYEGKSNYWNKLVAAQKANNGKSIHIYVDIPAEYLK